MVPFLISEFDKETLSNLVKECFGSDFPDIVKKKQIRYLYSYLTDLSAKSILLETNYVDKDYLEDYSRYYVKCFNRYGERCARLHFFSTDLDHSQLEPIFDDQKPDKIIEKIKNSYLGFIVIKPLPITFIGKTCLSDYPSFNSSKTKKVITKSYDVNLFGIDLKVESIAFQEQDKILSACATASIWSALHALPGRSTRDVPSLGEITLSAINHITDSVNSFPNKGLNNKQISRALDHHTLRNHTFDFSEANKDDQESFFQIVKSYIDSDIPLILGVDVYALDTDKKFKKEGQHAITILGYSDKEDSTSLYVHDDRHGPYAIATLSDTPNGIENNSICITLKEKNEKGGWLDANEVFIPESLMAPNNNKIRITADHIKMTCDLITDSIDEYLKGFLKPGEKPSEPVTYNFLLESLSNIRNRVLKTSNITNKKEVLIRSSARHQWSAKFKVLGVLSFEVLFDSTELPQGKAVSHILVHNEKTFVLVDSIFKGLLDEMEEIPEATDTNFFISFISEFEIPEEDHASYLNRMYGELRAPKKIKKSETSNNNLNSQDDVLKYFGHTSETLSSTFEKFDVSNKGCLIWAISEEGALLVGKEENDMGHPTLTGFKPARIAGELKKDNDGFYINAKSGRYSTDYSDVNNLLANALLKFNEIFTREGIKFRHEPYNS